MSRTPAISIIFARKFMTTKDNCIHFPNNKGERIVTFSNFNPIENTNCIRYDINITYGDFTAKVSSYSESYDYRYLISGLKKLYSRLIDTFEFCDIEQHLTIKFQFNETGHIILQLQIRNTDYVVKLDICFISDQTFIPGIIQEIESIIDIEND